jgi:hypothetical protein
MKSSKMSKKRNWYQRSTKILNQLIKKHPRSFLLFDFLKGKLVARSTDRKEIHEKQVALSKPGSSFLIYEPSKKPWLLALTIA